MTEIRGKRACPTSLHQTRTSTSWVMSEPSSFLPITTLLWIAGIAFPALFCQFPISVVICHLKLTTRSPQEIRSCTTYDNNQTLYKVSVRPQGENLTCCARKVDMEMTPNSLEDFLTKTTGVSTPWCESTSSLPFSICPSRR